MDAPLLLDRDDTQPLAIHGSRPGEPRPGPRTEGVLSVLSGPHAGALFALDANEAMIGRGGEAQILVRDEGVSRRHAMITRSAGGYWLHDLGSTNGTYLNARRIRTPEPLHDGDRIEIGATSLLRFGLHDAIEVEAVRRTHALTVLDPLTGLFNRRHVGDRLIAELAFARRHGTPLSVLLVDIDEFKQVNDVHGHEAGDAVLRVVAHAMRRAVRAEDVVGRHGGEEFVVLARGIDDQGSRCLAERIGDAVRVLRVPAGTAKVKVTVSAGVAYAEGDIDTSPAALIETADAALYEAKKAGRDRCSFRAVTGARTRRESATHPRSSS